MLYHAVHGVVIGRYWWISPFEDNGKYRHLQSSIWKVLLMEFSCLELGEQNQPQHMDQTSIQVDSLEHHSPAVTFHYRDSNRAEHLLIFFLVEALPR